MADYSKITELDINTDNVATIDYSELTGLNNLYFNGNTALNVDIENATFPTTLRKIYFYDTISTGDLSAASFPVGMRTIIGNNCTTISYGASNGFASLTYATLNIQLINCGLSETEVDAILADLVAGSINTGTLDISSNTVPSATGLTDKGTLVGRGWTVTTDV